MGGISMMLSTTISKLPRIKTLGIKQEERLDRTVQKVRDNPSPDSCFQTVPRPAIIFQYKLRVTMSFRIFASRQSSDQLTITPDSIEQMKEKTSRSSSKMWNSLDRQNNDEYNRVFF